MNLSGWYISKYFRMVLICTLLGGISLKTYSPYLSACLWAVFT
ncbi:hypothetical protein EVA_06464 [gut metagenome]|uniref:Uncharacterized protein n=1 Tax=gut metagenome TaxID=749906 RepID=J9CYS6_9ZZZZ